MEKQERKQRFPTFPQPRRLRTITYLWDTDSEGKVSGQPWCRNHSDPGQRQRSADARAIVAMILKMDSFNVSLALCNTLHELRAKLIPPLYAQTVFEAAAARLEHLLEEQVLAHLHPRTAPSSAAPANPHRNNGLQVLPMK